MARAGVLPPSRIDMDTSPPIAAHPPIYTSLHLPKHMADAARRSLGAPLSRVPSLDDDAIRPTHMSHLALATGNFMAVANWWQTVLNAKPSLEAEGMRFLAIDGEHHRVVVFDVPGLKARESPTPPVTGMHHIAFTYASFEHLAATYLRLKGQGILPWRAINHGTSFALDYYDPDYNNCELQCMAFPGTLQEQRAQLDDWLASGALNRNPIGVIFDMEESIRAFEAGRDVRDIITPAAMKIGEHTDEDIRRGFMAP